MSNTAAQSPRPGLLRRLWDMTLIILGFRDLLAETHVRGYRDVITAYGEALRIRINGVGTATDLSRILTAEIDAVSQNFTNSKASFARLLEVELRHFHGADDTSKIAIAQGVRERYQRFAAPAAIEAREKQGYPALKLPWTDAMSADTISIFNYIHARYIMNVAREEAVSRQKSVLLLRFRRIAAGFVAVVALGGLVWLAARFFVGGEAVLIWFRTFIAISLIFTLGYIGAAVSVSQRFQKAMDQDVLQADPVFTIGGIAIGQRGIDVAMVMAGVFSVLLYFVFAGGMAATLGFSGGLFPEVNNCPKVLQASYMGDLSRNLGFCGQRDLLRMFVFAFAAGYAERLVPDVLNRIASAGKAGKSES